MGFTQGLRDWLGNTVASTGSMLGLPELGLSEHIIGQQAPVSTNSLVVPQTARVNNQGGTQLGASIGPSQAPAGGGGGAPAPDPNAAALASGRNDVQSRIAQAMGLYNQLFGQVDQNVADQRNTYDQGYNTQQTQLGTDYQNTLGQIGQVMAGRGLADSSYLGDAQGQATNTYNTNLDALNQNRDSVYSNLGKFAQTEKQQLGAGRQDISNIGDLGQYDLASLQSLKNALDTHIAQAQQTQAGLGTNAQYQAALQAATPAAQQQGSAQLAAQLQKLKASGASPLLLNNIAQGLIKSAGKKDDPATQNLWQSIQSA